MRLFSYKSSHNPDAYEGYGIDVGRRIAEVLLGDVEKVAFVVQPGSQQHSLRDEVVDLAIYPWENTNDAADIALTGPFLTDSTRIMVPSSSGFSRITDLVGKVIAQDYGGALQGQVHAVAGTTLELLPFTLDNPDLVLLTEKYSTWTYHIAVLESKPDLLEAVDQIIREMAESGELDRLAAKWGLDK